jgi:hypothetical protein
MIHIQYVSCNPREAADQFCLFAEAQVGQNQPIKITWSLCQYPLQILIARQTERTTSRTMDKGGACKSIRIVLVRYAEDSRAWRNVNSESLGCCGPHRERSIPASAWFFDLTEALLRPHKGSYSEFSIVAEATSWFTYDKFDIASELRVDMR